MKSFERYKLYRKCLLEATPRVLTEIDRDPFSATYGSTDREYWAWATKDFSNIDLQRGLYPLTILYLTNFEGNQWYQQKKLRDWIEAAFLFWTKNQHRDGSFDHHYPNEHSFVGIAFTLYELLESFSLLDKKNKLTPEKRKFWIQSFKNPADYLCSHDELHGFISNHRAGAACALYSYFLISGDEKYKKRAYYFINSIKRRASSEGWLNEYNGADPGYQTLDTYYLANFFRMTDDQDVYKNLILPSLKFLIYFFHPDGSVGGEYGSRNCPLYFPAGFELLAPYSPEAEAIAQMGATAIMEGNSPALADHDIRNFVPMLSCYAQAYITASKQTDNQSCQMPFKRKFERYWPGAHLYVHSGHKYYTIVGISKGGVLKAFSKNERKLVGCHDGYMATFNDNSQWSTQFLSDSSLLNNTDLLNEEMPLPEKRMIQLTQPFYKVMKFRTMTPFRFLLFRIFNLSIGKIRWLNHWVRRNIITGIFIHRLKKASLFVTREIGFHKETISLKDHFSGDELHCTTRMETSSLFTTIYMGSAKYYRQSDLVTSHHSQINLLNNLAQAGSLAYLIDKDGLKQVH